MHRINRAGVCSLIVSLGVCVFLGGAPLLASGHAQGQSGTGSVLVIGVVKDGTSQGWPLYAKLVVSRPGFPNVTLFSDPVTGYYATELEAGFVYDFVVTAVAPGYVPGGGPVDLSTTAQNAQVASWSLFPAPSCNAPGFGPGSFVPPLALSEGFDGGVIPPGWTVDTSFGSGWTVATGADPCGQFPGNQTGGAGPYAIVNNFCEGPFSGSSLVTPPMDLSASTTAVIQWAERLRRPRVRRLRRRGGQHRRRRQLDRGLASLGGSAGARRPNRGYVLRGRPRQCAGAFSLRGFLRLLVAGG